MGTANYICFCNGDSEENIQQNLSNKCNNIYESFCFCVKNNSTQINQENLTNKKNYQENLSYSNNNGNHIINNEHLLNNYKNNNNQNKEQNLINNYNYNNYNNGDNKNNISINDNINNKENIPNNKENLSNNNYLIDNNYNIQNNKESLSNDNNNYKNNINLENNINESILSFIKRIFPKKNKNIGGFNPQIPPGTKGPFVSNIYEKITFTKEGQFIKVVMNLIIINLPENQCSISYGISFESQIYDVHCNLENNYEYDSHHIKFHYNLKNNETIKIEFDYKKYVTNICEYYRNEFVLISNIFPGAVGKYEVIIPEKYILIC